MYFWRDIKRYVFTLLFALASISLGEEVAPFVNDQKLAAIESRYGQPARKRLIAWMELIANNQQKSEQEKLVLVNDFFNQLLFVSDQDHWGKNDYWATPLEMLGSGGGDCEDYSISKYFTLLALGVPVDKLKITYVKARNWNPVSQAHMVLTYYSSPSAMPEVLDNLVGEIKPAEQRTDLTPVYSFNGEGLWLAKERGTGKSVASSNRIGLWRDLLTRMGKEY